MNANCLAAKYVSSIAPAGNVGDAHSENPREHPKTIKSNLRHLNVSRWRLERGGGSLGHVGCMAHDESSESESNWCLLLNYFRAGVPAGSAFCAANWSPCGVGSRSCFMSLQTQRKCRRTQNRNTVAILMQKIQCYVR